METGITLIYDGSFNGFLCAVYQAYEQKLYVTDIIKVDQYQKDIFSKSVTIKTDLKKAKRVWYRMRDKHYEVLKNIYFSFLSETSGIEIRLYREIVKHMGRLPIMNNDMGPGDAQQLEDLAANVSREKRKWE